MQLQKNKNMYGHKKYEISFTFTHAHLSQAYIRGVVDKGTF